MKKLILTLHQAMLATALLSSMPLAHSASEKEEIAQLRKEVQELRAMLQQSMQPSVYTATTASGSGIVIQSPKPPLAKSITSKAGAEVKLYGYVRADASYQMKGASSMYNNISGVPLEHTEQAAEQKDRLNSTVNVTRMGVDFKTPSALGQVGGKVEVDFFGGSSRDQFRIRHAYLTFNQWLIGQTWSTFIAPEYYPETVDAATYVGGTLQRSPLIRYSDQLSANTSFALALEDPKYTAASDPDNQMRLPALVGRLNHKFANGSLISGRTFTAEKRTSNDDDWSWGVGVGGKYQLSPQTFLKADYYHVKGDGRFVLWSNSSYVIDDKNRIQNNQFDSISTGITHQFNPQLRSTLGYGYMKAKDDNRFAELQKMSLTQNKKLWQGWINAMYNPYKPITLGLEYVYGERETFDGQTGVDNRFNMMAIYDF